MQKVLIPLDGSPFAEEVLERGLSQFQPESAEIILFHCVDLNTLFARVGHAPASIYIETELKNRQARHDYLDGLAAKVKENGFSVRSILATGDPVDRILLAARDEAIDTIVMTTHARSGLERLFVGSVTEGVLRGAHCLVLVVPAK